MRWLLVKINNIQATVILRTMLIIAIWKHFST